MASSAVVASSLEPCVLRDGRSAPKYKLTVTVRAYKWRARQGRAAPDPMCLLAQIGTTKGTGGDVLILEEAAYCDEGFFYET